LYNYYTNSFRIDIGSFEVFILSEKIQDSPRVWERWSKLVIKPNGRFFMDYGVVGVAWTGNLSIFEEATLRLTYTGEETECYEDLCTGNALSGPSMHIDLQLTKVEAISPFTVDFYVKKTGPVLIGYVQNSVNQDAEGHHMFFAKISADQEYASGIYVGKGKDNHGYFFATQFIQEHKSLIQVDNRYLDYSRLQSNILVILVSVPETTSSYHIKKATISLVIENDTAFSLNAGKIFNLKKMLSQIDANLKLTRGVTNLDSTMASAASAASSWVSDLIRIHPQANIVTMRQYLKNDTTNRAEQMIYPNGNVSLQSYLGGKYTQSMFGHLTVGSKLMGSWPGNDTDVRICFIQDKNWVGGLREVPGVYSMPTGMEITNCGTQIGYHTTKFRAVDPFKTDVYIARSGDSVFGWIPNNNARYNAGDEHFIFGTIANSAREHKGELSGDLNNEYIIGIIIGKSSGNNGKFLAVSYSERYKLLLSRQKKLSKNLNDPLYHYSKAQWIKNVPFTKPVP
jgi:hypothetical protein